MFKLLKLAVKSKISEQLLAVQSRESQEHR